MHFFLPILYIKALAEVLMEEPSFFCKEKDMIQTPKPNTSKPPVEHEAFDLDKLLRNVGIQGELEEEEEELNVVSEEENEESMQIEPTETSEKDEEHVPDRRHDSNVHQDGFHLTPYTTDLEYALCVLFAYQNSSFGNQLTLLFAGEDTWKISFRSLKPK